MTNYNSLRDLDHSCFKAFLAAATHLNFTKAAKMSGLTQSGVSQQIAKLENQIGMDLFERINRSVILTEVGKKLLAYIEDQQERLSSFLEEANKETAELTGPVRYAMPHSCLFTPHFPLLIKKARESFREVQLDVELCPNETVIELLIQNKIDFGFITQIAPHPGLFHTKFATEEYVLVGPHIGKMKPTLNIKQIEELPFLDYPGMDVLFEIWMSGIAPQKKLSYERLKMAGRINSLHGLLIMLQGGMGWTVLPSHVAAEEMKKGLVRKYEIDGRDKKITSDIYIVTLENKTIPRRVKAALDAFYEMKK